ncbi:MAG: DUF1080 domain-containing protein, partial [Lentisphaeraceae bacterium]|nr:DUF1080 domain-containing protein [Lentisphaeraceae bacterium]
MFKKAILSLSASVCLLACSTKEGIALHVSSEQAKTATNLIPANDLSTVWEGALSAYTVEDGVFYAKQNSNFRDLLYSKKDYENFVLNFKFRFPLKDQKHGANSGIGIRTPRQGEVFFKATDYKRFQPAHASIEVQILEDRHKSYEKLGVMGKNGAFYQIQAATNSVLKYDGQWNEETIIANGSKLKVILNGVVINEVDLLEAKAVKGYALGMHRTLGRIVICGHGPGVQFKDMSVVELPSSAKSANIAPAGFTTLFNGKDLTNWKGLLYRPYDKPHKRAGLSTDKLKALQIKADKQMTTHWTVTDNGEI